MLIITKENNSIKVVGQNNPTYPYSGTLIYPLNSVTVVTDQSDMAVFRSALNNDVLFTGLIDDITIAGSPVTKEDIGTKFGAISNASSTGGGGTGGGGAVDSVNGQTGTVVLSASDVNAYSKTESDGKYATKAEIPSTDNLATKQELAGETSEREKQDSALGGMIAGETEAREQAITNLTATVQGKLDTATYNEEKATFALKTEIPDTSTLATKSEVTEGLAGKANTSDLSNYLTTANAQSTYATKSELGAKLDVETYNSEKATFALKSELPDTSDFVTKATADDTYQPKGEYLTSIPENYVTDEELNGKGYATTAQLNGKQDALISGTNIKTINGNTLLGSGDITIEGGGITDAPSDDKTYGRKNGAWSEITEPDLSNYALKSQVPKEYVQAIGFVAPSSINIFDQEGNYKMIGFTDGITLGENGENVEVKLDDTFVNKVNAKQDALVSGTNIKTVNGNSLLGSGDITIEGGGSGGGAETYDFKGTSRCAELTYDVVKEGVILQNITLSGMNITTNGVLITLAKFDNTSAVGFALLSEGKYNGTNKPFLAQVLFSNVGGATISKYVSTTPTVQDGAEGSETNYIYSKKSDAAHRAVAMVSPGTIGDGEGGSTAGIVLRYWGDDVTTPLKFDYATSTRGGMMRSKDKNKLDTMPSEWFGTQSQFDGLEAKDENTLYFITEE